MGVNEPSALVYEFVLETSLFACLEWTHRKAKDREGSQNSEKGLKVVNFDEFKKHRESLVTPVDKAIRLLEPLEGTCTSLNAGYWSYKLCFGDTISQFHLEQVQVQKEGAGLVLETQKQLQFDLGTFVKGSEYLQNSSSGLFSDLYGEYVPERVSL